MKLKLAEIYSALIIRNFRALAYSSPNYNHCHFCSEAFSDSMQDSKLEEKNTMTDNTEVIESFVSSKGMSRSVVCDNKPSSVLAMVLLTLAQLLKWQMRIWELGPRENAQ
ncbi:hypothetical protein RIF29_20988 [Crotalaria pallida]|uniref:Uncharacterized protein n=1 Tax=Crotalaria pallida TaxID=3830 RepID=A0AAN9F5P3_CROPI